MRITEFPVLREIKDEYLNLRRDQHSRSAAVKALMEKYHNELFSGSNDDALLFWIGLADAQYAVKELDAKVAQHALSALDSIGETDWDICVGDLIRRKEHYMTAPMPEREKIGKSRKFRCSWKVGDTFAYQLIGDDAKSYGLEGSCILLRKVDELETWDGRLWPIVTLTMWKKGYLPTTSAEFSSEPILILNKRQFLCPAGTYEYRTELLVTSAQKLKRLNLIYIGNFLNVEMPSDEFIIREPGFITMTPLERFEWECCVYWQNHCFWSEEKQLENK